MNKKIPTQLAILIILLAIAVIVGIAFWICPEKETALPQSQTADWQTYQNEEGGYSFKYPKEWNAVTNKYNSKNVLFGPGATSESGYGGVEFSGTLLPDQSLKDFVKEFNLGVESGSVSEIVTTINGQVSIVSILPKAATETTETKSVSFEKNGKVFSIYLMYKTNFNQYPEDKQNLAIFNQMLSTFKFIENVSTFINQVTYICNGDKTINATFYKGETVPVGPGEMPIPSGNVKIVLSDGRNFDLSQTISASGIRYANSDESFVFWGKGNGVLVLENNVEKSYIGCVVLANDPGGLPKVYLDGVVGFSIRYPTNYLIDTSYKYQALGPGKDISGVKFTIPSSLTAGTNLSSFDTGVSVEIIPAIQDCNASLFLDGSTDIRTITDNGSEYSFASTIQGAAGNNYEERVWAIPGTNPCIAIRYFIHSTNIGNYPEGTVLEFNKAVLMEQFEKIRHSLTIL